MKSATLFAIGFLSAGVWLQGNARGQTLVAPPLSLAPPSTEQGAAPPVTPNNASPPRAPAKNARPPARSNGGPAAATDALPPAASDKVSPPPVISGPPSSLNSAVDYDGFSVGTVDDSDTSSQAARTMRSRAAIGSKPNSGTDSIAGQQSADQEDEALKRKLTICRGCK